MPYIIQNSATDRHRAFKNVNTANRSIRSKTGKFIKDNVQSTVAIDADQTAFAEGKRATAQHEHEDYPEMQEMPFRDRLDYQLQKPKTRDLKTSVGNYSSQHIQNLENQSSSKLRGYAQEHIPHATSEMFFLNQQFAGQ